MNVGVYQVESMMKWAGAVACLLAALGVVAAVSGCATTGPDITNVLKRIQEAWHDYKPCFPTEFCTSYFDSFGVAIMFADGTTRPLAHIQRMDISGHDCIENAQSSLENGDRALAVEWVMASQRSAAAREWMRQHPDSVIKVLPNCCSL